MVHFRFWNDEPWPLQKYSGWVIACGFDDALRNPDRFSGDTGDVDCKRCRATDWFRTYHTGLLAKEGQ